jgi:sugar/nucleoside kinase (ribokinase family)
MYNRGLYGPRCWLYSAALGPAAGAAKDQGNRSMDKGFDVVGIGNAIVDILSHADDAFLEAHGLAKGAMTLIDAERASTLYRAMGPAVESSGGSAGNTIAGVASLGGRGAFIGKVNNDQFGGVFRHDIRASGVTFDTAPSEEGPPTARCLIFVTDDAQRTMQTYLEGYLWDPPRAKQAFLKAAEIARKAGRKVALTLSDPFCVDRHRAEFQELVEKHVDILFANEKEICSLWQIEDFDKALQITRGKCEMAALTRSAQGSIVVAGDELHVVDAAPVRHVIDTTGAGDLYAAGFLYGYTSGKNPYDCARIAAIAAAEVISHFGARPQTPLTELLLAELR